MHRDGKEGVGDGKEGLKPSARGDAGVEQVLNGHAAACAEAAVRPPLWGEIEARVNASTDLVRVRLFWFISYILRASALSLYSDRQTDRQTDRQKADKNFLCCWMYARMYGWRIRSAWLALVWTHFIMRM